VRCGSKCSWVEPARALNIVGLWDAAVEANGRVQAAIQSPELTFPGRWVAVNLDDGLTPRAVDRSTCRTAQMAAFLHKALG